MYDSAIICNEVVDTDADVEAKSNDETKSKDKAKSNDTKLSPKDDETNFNEKEATCKTQNFYILLVFLLITMTLLISVSIYCYLIKYRAKQLLPFHYTNNELGEVL